MLLPTPYYILALPHHNVIGLHIITLARGHTYIGDKAERDDLRNRTDGVGQKIYLVR